ncbi:MAG: NAD(P)/FAD-dependent oxidoreductase [bacterium]|nr:NAD(P)/FAD-dependent oxidoreductase [bacterium]
MTFSTMEYDAVVAGGGPAGATAATLIAQRGCKTLLIERSPAPEFKVGESLMPATYWIFERLGVLDQMKASRFPKKYSVQFFSSDGKASTPFYFRDHDAHESSQTWQVLRSEFDQMLLDNAVAQGVEVRRGVTLKDVLFDGDRAVGARVSTGDDDPIDLASRVFVDATGQRAFLAGKLGLLDIEPSLKNAAFFSHFKGGYRDSGVDEGATIIFHTDERKSWFWSIPLPDDTVSVGVVGDISHLILGRSRDPQTVFEEELAHCPAIAARIDGAGQAMPMRAIRDFSYSSARSAGNGWVLAGDAVGFIDPVYSTGVFLALKSGEMAADSICSSLEAGDLSAQSLGSHIECYRHGVDAMRQLVYAFYDPEFSFARFLARYPGCKGELVDLLVGNVYRKPLDRIRAALAEEAGRDRSEMAPTRS